MNNENVQTPSIAVTKDWQSYAKSVEAFNTSLHNTLVNLYSRLNDLEEKINALSNKDISKISDEVAKEAAEKLATMPANQQLLETVNAQVSSTLSKFASQVNDALAKLSGAINDSNQKLNAVQATLSNLQSSVSQLEDKQKSTSVQLDQLSQRTISLSNDITKVRQESENEINELQAKFTKLYDDFYKGTTQVNDIVTRLSNLENKVQQIDATVQKLVTVVNSDTLDVSSFKTRLDTIASQINAISDVITKTQQDVLAFVNSANNAIGLLTKINPEAIEVRLGNSENRISGLENQITKAISVINNQGKEIIEIKQNVTDINKTIQELQSKLPK